MTATLAQRIARMIQAVGPISIAQYMTMALHDPKEGYYATRDPLGQGGDFITAPEISQMFGELIALWFADCWSDQGSLDRPLFIELGPGRGTLMTDMLRALKIVPRLREQMEVVLVENSPVLRAVQEAALKDCGVAVRWVSDIGEVPDDRPHFVIANEFFDALPIHQFVRREDGWHERMVTTSDGESLAFALSPLALMPARTAPLGSVLEEATAAQSLIQEIARRIAAQDGVALVIDYGYAAPQFADTLQALRQHRFADVLERPGSADLTAHVDFAALSAAVWRAGAEPFEVLEQGDFLRMMGIEKRAAQLGGGAVMERQVQRLIAPDQMGKLFKALAVTRVGAPSPPCFSSIPQRSGQAEREL